MLDDHLGTRADELPVVVEKIDLHRWVDVDIALAEVAGRDADARLLGVGGGDQRHHSSLGDLIANAEWGRFRQGQVDRLNVATGPDDERATVAFGLHLFRYRGGRSSCSSAATTRSTAARPRLEVIVADPRRRVRPAGRGPRAAVSRSVLRGQVVSFAGNPYERSMGGITFVRRPDLPADRVILPEGTLAQVRGHVVELAAHRDELPPPRAAPQARHPALRPAGHRQDPHGPAPHRCRSRDHGGPARRHPDGLRRRRPPRSPAPTSRPSSCSRTST